MLRQLFALLAFLLLSTTPAYDTLKSEAEKAFDEKSFARAHELYEQVGKLSLSAEERRWVDFRLADTAARADEEHRGSNALEEIVRASGENHDRVWAEANESLGDLTGDINFYMAALDWWAGSGDIPLARKRYLAIVRRMAETTYIYQIPREVLVNAIAIADSKSDEMRARHLLAQQLLADGRPDGAERAFEHLEAIIAAGKASEWYDDALFLAAQNYASGRSVVVNDQAAEPRSNYTRALELYRRLLSEFAKGESHYRDDAERAIAQIVAPSVSLQLAGTFLPDSEQELHLGWRNTKRVELAITPVDLTDFRPKNSDWIEGLHVTAAPLRKWTFETADKGDHVPGYETIRIAPRVERGAYLLTADANKVSAKALLLVTDAHIMMHASPTQLQVYVSDVLSGAPIAGAKVRVWQQRNDSGTVTDAVTNDDGLALVKKLDGYYGGVVVTASNGRTRQAWHSTWSYSDRGEKAAWKIYAFTDRPAYRPGETVQWKILARTRSGDSWATPSAQKIAYEIVDPRGEKVKSGEATLSAFGSFWDSLPLTGAMTLGEYSITFRPLAKSDSLGQAILFRLEEYKLPEFRVRVSTPDGKLYRLGETVEATIEAEYYFGGPVANATVEALVMREPFFRYWYPWRKYPWYYPAPREYGETIVKRETLKTDANGRAVIRMETTRDGGDARYRIEARVVDSSRREVRGEGNVAITRQSYSVLAHPEHYLYRPGEAVEVELKALDANDQPVQASGIIRVIRRQWREKQRAYLDDDVIVTQASTNAKGEATFTFTPKREGYYSVQWTSVDQASGRGAQVRDRITAETTVWVADRTTTDLGYATTSGLEIIADRDTMRTGDAATLMIVSPVSGRWVVFNASGDDLLATQVLHLDGTVKLVHVPLDSRYEPNFHVTASSMFNRTFSTDSETITVPPEEHFIDVSVKPDRDDVRPRDEGTLTITTRDVTGKPVAAEVALAVSDEAVTAIQKDPAGDPREFFFGELRSLTLQASAGAQTQQYIRLVPGKDKQLRDDRYEENEQGVAGGRAGGYFADALQETGAMSRNAAMAPPPAPVAQAITVTAEAPLMKDGAAASVGQEVEVQVRTDFRSTALWKPDVITDASGTATVKVKYPESLTSWRATARAATAATAVGMGSSTVRTNMPLMVRLQAPRFFVAGDNATVSAVINNNTDGPLTVEPHLEVEGLTLNATTSAPVSIAAHGEARADWNVVADRPGTAKLRVSGRSSQLADAMEKSFTVYEHGIDKLIARSGKLRGGEALLTLDLPRERRATELTIGIAPTLAVTMLGALPSLVDYPYGCTEQTMSRFLPATIVMKTLAARGIDARKRIPKLDDVTTMSIKRLYDFQHEDGGWGWWKEGESDSFMTAYVVWGFALARDAGMNIDEERLDRASRWLDENLDEHENDWNRQAWMLHAIAEWSHPRMSKNTMTAFDDVWEHRERLASYSRALLAMAAYRFEKHDRAAVLVRNLENGVKIDRAPDQSVLVTGSKPAPETMATAHWGSDTFWWHWFDGPVETTAFALRALVMIDPTNKLVEPSMNWLVKNRRGAAWHNTRDTAIAVLALNDYLRASGETAGDVTFELSVNGRVIAAKTITKETMLSAERFTIDPAIVADTQQQIRIRRTSGSAPLYFSAEARFVSLEEPVRAAGNELFVKREYFRLAPKPTLLKGVTYDRVPLGDGDSVVSGERIEVVATIETKNDYEYLMFEDLKPAGFEAVELQSGTTLYATSKDGSKSQWIYQELRDRKVAMFADELSQGIWEIHYTLRAETPGSFHALPLIGQCMYVPEVKANGEEVRVVVR